MGKRKRTKTSLAIRATELAQTLARLTETDEDGWGVCCSCGQAVHYRLADGGHFQAKGRHYNGACLDPRNIHLQCKGCNRYRQGNSAGYALFMIEEYGRPDDNYKQIKDFLAELEAMGAKTLDREIYEAYIEKTAPLVQRLKNEKCFEIWR